MTNYMPIIAEQILNIELYNYFKIKCTDKKYPRNQTYYLGYDGLHHRKDEVNTDNELLNKIITGQAEIIYIKNSQDKLTNKNTFQIYAIKESWKLGNFEVMEWKLLYYIMNLFYKNHDISQTIEFNEFEQYYHYTTNMITTENRILSSLYNKKILTSYQKYKDKKSMIIISTNFLELWNFHKSNYIYTAEYISYFKSKASFPFFNYIIYQLKNEKTKFNRTLEKGLREFEKITKNIQTNSIDKDTAFKLYDTYGFPIELTEELAKEQGLTVDMEGFKAKFEEHQAKSRAGSEQKFKGGLASTGEIETKYHTATHLLNAALKKVLGEHVHQRGSNITAERMRFDFTQDEKMTDEQKKQTEDLVNEYIKMAIPVERLEMPKEEAVKMGAECQFIERYPDIVTVYKIGDVSLEICGGPHVSNTSELGTFKIKKEESSSAGVRRIKAILS